MFRILRTSLLRARPLIGMQGSSLARLLSLDCGTHCAEDKTEIKISRPADCNANSEPFGTGPGFRHRPVVNN